jgi:DNA polymerase-3 subunit epsilon
MTETGSVTRSGCDLLVALDASSMSGKAKQARKFGIPVVSSEEFLRRIESGEAKMNSHGSS